MALLCCSYSGEIKSGAIELCNNTKICQNLICFDWTECELFAGGSCYSIVSVCTPQIKKPQEEMALHDREDASICKEVECSLYMLCFSHYPWMIWFTMWSYVGNNLFLLSCYFEKKVPSSELRLPWFKLENSNAMLQLLLVSASTLSEANSHLKHWGCICLVSANNTHQMQETRLSLGARALEDKCHVSVVKLS